jgi:hypothetical protein
MSHYSEYHYVYSINFESGHVYYGLRTCKHPITPEKDTDYVGSPVTFKKFWKNKFKKNILATFSTREKATELEVILIKRQWGLDKNKSLNASFSTNGHVDYNIKFKDLDLPYFLISPQGQMFSGNSVYLFCKLKKLKFSSMRKVLIGTYNQHKGWTTNFKDHLNFKYYNTTITKLIKPPKVIVNLESGDRFKVFSVKKFAREHRLCSASLQRIINGIGLVSQGFCLEENLLKVQDQNKKFKIRKEILISNLHLTDSEVYKKISQIEPNISKTAIYSWIHVERKRLSS